MINFKKAYCFKIIAIVVVGTTIFSTTTLYPYPVIKESALRVQSSFQNDDSKRRVLSALSSDSAQALISISKFDQEKLDTASLKNYPDFLVYAPTMVAGYPFNTEAGGDEFIKRVSELTAVLKNVLGDFVSTYSPYHMHCTIGTLKGGDYLNPNKPLTPESISFAKFNEIPGIIKSAKQFTIKFERILVNSSGEILLMGKASDGESRKTLSDLREQLKDKAKFGLRDVDINDNVHVMIGYIKEIPSQEKIKELKEQLANTVEPWLDGKDYFSKIIISKIKLVQYAHRSLNKIAGKVEFTLGDSDTIAGQEIKKRIIDDAKPILINIQDSLRLWMDEKLALCSDPLNRQRALSLAAHKLIFLKKRVISQYRTGEMVKKLGKIEKGQSVSIKVSFLEEEGVDFTNDFEVSIPDRLSDVYIDLIADYLVARILNTMLANGGPKVNIIAPEEWQETIGKHLGKNKFFAKIKEAMKDYYGGGVRITFSQDESKIEKAVSVASADKEVSVLNDNKRGVYIGIDVGGSSIKMAALIGDKEIYLGKIDKGVYSLNTAEEYINLVKSAISEAQKKLSKNGSEATKVDGIGISWNAAVKDRQLRLPVFVKNKLGVKGTYDIEHIEETLKEWIEEKFGKDTNIHVKNDGYAGAFEVAYSCNTTNTAYFGLGSSVAFGFIDKSGRHVPGYTEAHYARIDLRDDGRGVQSGTPGALAYYISSQGFIKMAQELKLIEPNSGNDYEQNIRELIDKANNGDGETVMRIAEEIGSYLAEAIAEFSNYWPIRNTVIGGGLATGKFGDKIIETAQNTLKTEYPNIPITISKYKGSNSFVSAIGIAKYARAANFKKTEALKLEKALEENYDAFIFDADGTLTDTYGKIPNDILSKLVDLLVSGKYVCVASGRSFEKNSTESSDLLDIYKNIKNEIERHRLPLGILKHLYFAPENASYIINAVNIGEEEYKIGDPIFNVQFQRDVFHELIKQSDIKDKILSLGERNSKYMFTIKLKSGCNRSEKENVRTELESILNNRYKGKFQIYVTLNGLDIAMRGANKIRSVEYFKEKIGIHENKIAAVGDQGGAGGNDFFITNRKGGFTVLEGEIAAADQINVSVATGLQYHNASRYLLDRFCYKAGMRPNSFELNNALALYLKTHHINDISDLFKLGEIKFIGLLKDFVKHQQAALSLNYGNKPQGLILSDGITSLNIFAVSLIFDYYIETHKRQDLTSKVGLFVYGAHSKKLAVVGSDFDFALYAHDDVPSEIQGALYRFLAESISYLGFGKVSPSIQSFIRRGVQDKRLESIMDRVRFSELRLCAGSTEIGMEIEQAKKELNRDPLEEFAFNFLCNPIEKIDVSTDTIDLKRREGSLRDISRLIWLGQIYSYLAKKEFIQNPFEDETIFSSELRENIKKALQFFLALRNTCHMIGFKGETLGIKEQKIIAKEIPWFKDSKDLQEQYLKHVFSIRSIKEQLKGKVFYLLDRNLSDELYKIYSRDNDSFITGLSAEKYLELAEKSMLLKYLIALKCSNPDVLEKIYHDAPWSIRYALARNENCPPKILGSIIQNTSYEERDVRLMVTRNKNATRRILASLLRDEAEVVRNAAAQNLEEKLVIELSNEEKMLMLIWPYTQKSVNIPEHTRIKEKFGVDLHQICERDMQTVDDIIQHINAMMKDMELPFLFTINQEGGRLNELNMVHTLTPGNMALGAIKDIDEGVYLAYKEAAVIAKELRASGIAWNFAPDVDLLYEHGNRDVGTRSFGSDPERVAKLAAAFIKGLQDNGVMATAKHFPTYGRAKEDAHISFNRIKFDPLDLVPYKAAINAGVDSIMLGHVIVEDWDSEKPVTISEKAINIIRKDLGYNGLIITDGLEMRGLVDIYRQQGKDPKQVLIDAFQAGVDLMLFTQDFTYMRAKEDVEKENDERFTEYLRYREFAKEAANKFTAERINSSFRRLIKILIKYGITKPLDKDDLQHALQTPEAIRIVETIGEKSITLIKNDGQSLPLDLNIAEKILVLDIVPSMTAYTDKTWFNEFSLYDGIKERCKTAGRLTLNLRFNREEKKGPDIGEEIENALNRCQDYDVIVIGTYNSYLPDIREGKKNQAELVRAILKKYRASKKIIVVAFGTPCDIIDFPDVSAYVAAYSPTPGSIKAVAKMMFGEIAPTGILPVGIPQLYSMGYGLSYWDYESLREKYKKEYSLNDALFQLQQGYGSHAEGPILDDHLRAMLVKLKNITQGDDQFMAPQFRNLAICYQNFLKDFIFLHDIGKLGTINIEIDDKNVDINKYLSLPDEDKKDPSKTNITYPNHEERSYDIVQSNSNSSDKLALLIRIHGIESIFRKETDSNTLKEAYRKLYNACHKDDNLVNLAFLAMYIDVAGSYKVRQKGQKPFTEEKLLLEGFFKARDLFQNEELIRNLKYVSFEARKWVYKILKESKSGHLGGPLSSVELLTALYFGGILHYDPDRPDHPNRDRVLIRGHMGPVRYPILSMAGFFPKEKLFTYRKFRTTLPGHEDYRIVPGVDITPSGSLGMLLSYGTGAAHIAKVEYRPYKVYVFLGDGEEQEGNVSEAARNASYLKLDNLVCIIDKNTKQLTNSTKNVESSIRLKEIWEGYGWHVIEIEDGHDIGGILNAYKMAYYKDKPTLIIANTVKGKGIPGIEDHRTGMHSGRELTGSGFEWDDLIKMQDNEQGLYEKLDYEKFIEKIKHIAIPLPEVEIIKSKESLSVKIEAVDKKYENMIKALNDYFEALNKELKQNNRPFKVHSLAADFLPSFRINQDVLKALGSYVDVGLKEQHMVAMAHGISVTNPDDRVFVMVGDEFLYRAADQLHACAQGKSDIIFLTCDAGISGSFNGPTHQSSGQPGMIAMMPGMTMLEPADVYDLYNCLNWAVSNKAGPVYIRMHIVPIKPIVRPQDYDTIRGYNIVYDDKTFKDKPDGIIIASGFLVSSAIEASRILAQNNVRIKVISVTKPKDLDEQFVQLLDDNVPILTVYNGNPIMLQSLVAKAVLEYPKKRPSVIKGHGFEYGLSGSITDLAAYFKFTPETLIEVIGDKLGIYVDRREADIVTLTSKTTDQHQDVSVTGNDLNEELAAYDTSRSLGSQI